MATIRFHLISKGNDGTRVFKDDYDRTRYMDLLAEVKTEFDFEINHLSLMDTHVHKTAGFKGLDDMAAIMKFVNERYAHYYREKYGGQGHVWRNRFKRHLIEDDAYMLTCGIYIELNPVRAGMVEKPSDYRWSSHRFYLGDEENSILTPSPTILGLSDDPDRRRASYIKLTKLWMDKPVDKIQAKKFFKSRSGQPCTPH